MDYFLRAGHWSSLFAVPDAVVDRYIKLASGSAVKVLLYVLRNSGKSISSSEISSRLNIGEDDVKDAFDFWNEVGILSTGQPAEAVEEPSEQTVSAVNTVQEKPAAAIKKENLKDKEIQPDPGLQANVQPSSGNYSITPREIEKMKEDSREISDMIDMAQQTTGSMITPGMLKSLIWQHEYLGLRIDVILMLLSYCTSINKAHVSYIETIAVSWSRNDIDTLEKAQNEIERMSKSASFNNRAAAALGLKRHPTPNQLRFFEEWHRKGYSPDLIECACERAADLGKTLTANYINGILENWNRQNIKTRKQAEAETKYKGKTKPYMRREQSYDISEFEQLAVTLSSNTKKKQEDK